MLGKIKTGYIYGVKTLGTNLGIDAGYFVKGGVYGTLQQVIGLASGLAIAYSFGHFASKSVFGEYNLLLSIVSLVSIVSLPGLNISLLRSVGRGYDNSLNQAVRTRLKWSLLGIPVLIATAYYYSLRGSDTFPSALLVAAIFFPFLQSFQTTLTFFQAKKRFDIQAIFVSAASLATGLLVGLAVYLRLSLLIILAGYFLGNTVSAIFSFVYSQRLVAAKNRKDNDLLPYGYFLTAVNILPTVASQLGQILLASYLGVEKLAIFAVASKFPGIVQKNFDVFFKPVTVKLASQSNEEHRSTLKKHLPKFILAGVGMFAFIWLLSPTLISLFYGQQYQEAVPPSRIYAWLILPLPVLWLFGDMINFQKRRRTIFFLNTMVPIAKLVAYFFVIPRWQITGLIAIKYVLNQWT